MFADPGFLVVVELGDRAGWIDDVALGAAAITCTEIGCLLDRAPEPFPNSNKRSIPNAKK